MTVEATDGVSCLNVDVWSAQESFLMSRWSSGTLCNYSGLVPGKCVATCRPVMQHKYKHTASPPPPPPSAVKRLAARLIELHAGSTHPAAEVWAAPETLWPEARVARSSEKMASRNPLVQIQYPSSILYRYLAVEQGCTVSSQVSPCHRTFFTTSQQRSSCTS